MNDELKITEATVEQTPTAADIAADIASKHEGIAKAVTVVPLTDGSVTVKIDH